MNLKDSHQPLSITPQLLQCTCSSAAKEDYSISRDTVNADHYWYSSSAPLSEIDSLVGSTMPYSRNSNDATQIISPPLAARIAGQQRISQRLPVTFGLHPTPSP